MAREELQHQLDLAIDKAQRQIEPVNIPNLMLDNCAFNLTVHAITKPKDFIGSLIVVFTDVATPPKSPSRKRSTAEKAVQLELVQARDEIQFLREKMQSSQEELKSTNEELQSKVDDLSVLNDDMKNLLDRTGVDTIFLDKQLKVRRFTTHISHLFKLIPSDVGRPLSDVTTVLDYNDLENDSRKVLQTLEFIEKEIQANNQRWFKVRIIPYRTQADLIGGVVISCIDITDSTQVQEGFEHTRKELKKSLSDFEEIFNLSAYMVCIASHEGYFRKISSAFTETLGFSENELLAKPFADFVHPDDKKSTNDKMEPLAKGIPIIRFQNRYICKDSSYKWLEWTARSFDNGGGNTCNCL